MAVRCGDCGGCTSWDDDVGSAICTTCGTLVDPSQSILTSHIDQPENSRQYNPLWDPSSTSTLKSFRTGNGWNLAGQGKEARERKNSYAMHDFIRSLSSTLSASGLSPRAINLFTQAMVTGRYRWGRKAKLVAGACLAIALRESSRPDSLRDIAFLLDESLVHLTRIFSSVIALLNLALTPADPALYISSLQSHLSSMLQSQLTSGLPQPLLDLLTPLSLPSVVHTANSLTNLLSRLGENIDVVHLPAAPTACAIFMLALEGEARTSFLHLSELAQCLAARCHVGKGVVMSRYKTIQDIIAEWIKEVPWLDKYNDKKVRGRAKLAKRVVVARGLGDVVQFQEEIWRNELEAIERPRVTLEVDEGDQDQSGSDSDSMTSLGPATSSQDREFVRDRCSSLRPRKKRKIHNAFHQASQFLLNPLSCAVPSSIMSPLYMGSSSQTRSNSPSTISSPAPPSLGLSSTPPAQSSTITHLPLTSYLLTAPSSALDLRKPPSRLQLLSIARGGAGPEEVDDDELFEEGELDGIIRSEEERQKLRDIWGWDERDSCSEENDLDKEDEVPTNRHKNERKMPNARKATMVEERRGGSKRVNMEALAKLLEMPDDDKDDETYMENFFGQSDEDKGNDDDDDGAINHDENPTPRLDPTIGQRTAQDDTEVVVDEWRPLSPNIGPPCDIGNWYDEQYE